MIITNDTLHHDFNIRWDEIKRLSQKYADRLEEYPNVLATNFMRDIKTQNAD